MAIKDTTAIHMGYLDQERQFLQSTKQLNNNTFTQQPDKTLATINTIVPFTAKTMAYGDLTGSLSYTSSRGAKYLFIMYDYDANAILVHTLKTKQAHEIKQAWLTLSNRVMRHGHILQHYVLDNKCSHELKHAIKKTGNDCSISSTTYPQAELYGTCNQDVQSTFHFDTSYL